MELLEDRIVPASTISVIVGAAGTGSLDSFLGTTDGTITTADGGMTAGTVSTGALAAVGSSTNIDIAALDSISFANLGGTFTLQTALGNSVSFSAGTGAIAFTTTTNTLATGGAGLTFTAGTDLTLASLNTAGGDVALSAGNSAAGNVVAQSILTAGSGNISITATNVAGGTISQTGTASGLLANVMATGNITLDSLRGSTVNVTSDTGSISSLGTNAIQATSQLTLNSTTGINVRTTTPSVQATNSTSGNISIIQNGSPTQALTTVGSGVRNLVSGGTISLTNLGSVLTVSSASPVLATNGDVTLAATDFVIAGSVDAGTGRATLANATAGRQIDLGTNAGGAIGLTDAELDLVTGSVLVVGSATAGNITVSAAITRTASPLTLINNGSISEGASGTISVTSLRVSSTGPVTLDNVAGNNVGTVAASTTGGFSLTNGTNALSVGVVDGVTGISTTNSAVTLIADTLDIANAITAGTARVRLAAFTSGRNVDLGTETGGQLSLTDTEIDQVAAGVLEISTSGAGNISVTAAITPSQISTLTLTGNGGTLTDAVSGSIVVANLRASFDGAVTLDNAANDVDTLAGSTTAMGSDFAFVDADGFTVGTVDTVSGLTTNTSAGTGITLTAGGAVTQAMGANLTTNELELLGAGSYLLTNQTNNASFLGASLTTAGTGSLDYVDADTLSIGVAGATNGITTNNSNVSVTTTNGDLTVVNTASATDVNAGTASIFLTAGSTSNDNDVVISAGAAISGSGEIILTADNISVGAAASVNSGAGTTTLRPFEVGTLIDLGGADGAGTLGITDAELDLVTAGNLVVGRATAGNLSVTGPITPAASNQLDLVTGAAILDANAAMDDLTVNLLSLIAGTGIGVGGGDTTLEIVVTNVEATTTSGGVSLSNSGALVVGGVSMGLTGITSGGGTISVVATGAGTVNDLTVSEAITNTGGGDILLENQDADSAVTLALNAAVSTTGGNGNITVNAEDDLTVAAAVSTSGAMMMPGTGSITLRADSPTNGTTDGSFINSGSVTSEAGAISILGADVTIAGAVSSTAGGAVSVTAANTTGDLLVTAAISSAGGNGNISLTSQDDVSVTAAVSTGNAMMTPGTGTVTVTADADVSGAGDFSNTGAGTLSSQAGAISVSGAGVSVGAGVSSTGGGAISASATEAASDLSVNAAVTSSGGNGNVTLSSLDDVVVTGAVSTGDATMTGTGTVTITADLGGSGAGSFTSAAGGTISTQAGAVSISGAAVTIGAAIDSTAGGAISAAAVEAASDLAVNATITSSGGNGTITLASFDDVIVSAAVATSNTMMTPGTGNISVIANNDLVGGGDFANTATGTLTAQAGSISATGNAVTIGAALGTTAGGAISILAGGATGDLAVNAALSSSGGNGNVILSSLDDVIINAAVSTSNSVMTPGTGVVNVTADAGGSGAGDLTITASGSLASEAGAITVSSVNTTLGGAVTTSAGGSISASATTATGDLMVNAAVMSSGGNGNISLTSLDDVSVTGAVSTGNAMMSGTGTVTVTADSDTSGVGSLTSSAGGTISSQAGAISLSGASTTIGDVVSSTGGGAISALATEAASDLTVNAAITSTGGNGNIILSSLDDVVIAGAVSTSNSVMTPGTGTVIVTADLGTSGAGDVTVTGTGSVASEAGVISATGVNVSVGGTITATAGGAVSLTANGAGGDVTVTAAVTSSGGNGNISLSALGDVSVTAAVSTSNSIMTPGTGSVVITTGGVFSNSTTGTISTQNGGVSVTSPTTTVGGSISVAGGSNITFTAGLASGTTFTNQSTISSGGGNVTIRYDSQDLQAGSAITVAANREVNLRANTGGVGADLGSAAAGLNFTQAELDTITAGQLRITSAANTTFSQSITLTQVQTLVLEAVGGIIDGTAGEQTDLTVNSVAFKTSTGIGDADDIDLAVTNLAFRNVTSGAVNVANTGALTIDSVFDVTTSSNSATGAGNTTSVVATSPLTFAVNTTTTGDTTYTAGETNDPGTLADDLTVNTGVTVSVTAGNLTLQAGDDVILNSGSMVSASGSLTITAGFNDLDNAGGLVLGGTISGDPLSLSAVNDIVVGAITGGTISITSTQGAIFDGNDGMTPGTLNITAISLTLNANQGIGVTSAMNPTIDATAAPLEVDAGTLVFANMGAGTAGDVAIVDTTGGVTVTGTNAATGGMISLTTLAGGTLTVDTTGVTTTNGDVTLTTDDIAFAGGGTVNAGTAAATLQQQTDTFGFIVGTMGANSLIVADAELDLLTAGVVRLGRTTASGNFLVDDAITTHAGFSTLALRSGGLITQNGTITVGTTGTGSLAVTSVGSVALDLQNMIATIAASVTGAGNTLSLSDANDLAVGSVDGVDGVSTNNGGLTVVATAGNLTITNTMAMADVSAGSGTVFLIAGNGVTNTFTNSAGASIAGTGNIFVLADNMDLQATSQFTTTGTGELRPNTGVAIDVGGADVGGGTPMLGLTSDELNTITAGVLGIGVAGTSFDSGSITVTAAVAPTGTTTLRLRTGGSITQTTGSTITETNLRLQSAMAVALTEANDVDVLSASISGAGQGLSFTDADDLTIGTVDGQNGITTSDAVIVVQTTSGGLTVNQDISAGIATITLTAGGTDSTFANTADISNAGGSMLNVQADRFALGMGSTISAAGGGRISLSAVSAGRAFDLGSATDVAANAAELSDAELDTITTTDVLQIGDATAGSITVSVPIDTANVLTLALVTGGGVSGTGGITEANVRIDAVMPVTLTGTNQIGTLAASVTGMGNGLSLTNATALTIGTVDGVSGITTNAGAVSVANTGDVTVAQDISAGAAVTLSAGGPDGVLTNSADILGTSASLIGDRIDLQAGSTIQTGTMATNVVTLTASTVGRLVDLGSATDAATNTLELSDAEIDTIVAGILRLGDTMTGDVSFTASISPLNASTLSITSGGAIIDNNASDPDVVVSNLALRAANGIAGTTLEVDADLLAATNTASGSIRVAESTGDLTIGTVDGLVGISNSAATGGIGSLIRSDAGNLIVNQNVSSTADRVTLQAFGTNGTIVNNAAVSTIGGPGIDLVSDRMTLEGGTVSAGAAGRVRLLARTGGRAITLGSAVDTGAAVELSDAELDTITTTGVIQIGTQAGGLGLGETPNGAISLVAAISTMNPLDLESAGGITQTAGSTITAFGLAIRAGDDVVLTENNASSGIAVSVTGANNSVSFTGSSPSVVDGLSGVTATGDINLIASELLFNGDVTGGGNVTLTQTLETGAGGYFFLDGNRTVRSTAGNVVVNGHVMFVGAGSAIVSDTGSVTLNLTGSSVTPPPSLTVNGALSAASPIVVNGSSFGNTQVTFNLASGATVSAGGVAVNYTAGGNTLVLEDSAGTAARTYDLNANTGVFNVGLAGAITASGPLGTVLAFGGSGSDTFNVTPGASVAVNVRGAGSVGTSGDSLNLNLTGVTGTNLTLNGADPTAGGTYTFANRAAVSFTGVESLSPSVVSITATDTSASESGAVTGDNGLITLTRFGDTSVALTVNFTLSGTAVNGLDFTAVGGSVTFAAGSSTATISINAINNSLVDGARTVIVTLAPGAGYIGAGASATVTIADNDTVSKRVVTGSSLGGDVRVFDNGSDTPTFAITPYPGFPGGVVVAVGDVTGDGIEDFATGVAVNGPSHIKTFNGATGAELLSFFAFDPNYTGGVNIAMADLNGDGRAELIVGASQVAPHVKIFDGLTGAELASFFAYTTGAGANSPLNIGVSIAAGDTDGDGIAEVITGAKSGGPHVKTFDITGREFKSFFAFSQPQIMGGITVAAGDINGDGIDEIIAGGNFNGLNVVNIFNPDTSLRNSLAFPTGVPSTSVLGPALATVDQDADGDLDLLVTLGANILALDGVTLSPIDTLTPYPGFQGGVFVG